MRSCNRYQPTGLATYTISRRSDSWIDDARSQAAKYHHVLFFFMCRSTCSHCWKQAIALAKLKEQLDAIDTTVLLVGDGRYREQAQWFVKEMNIPFRYIADNGALRRYYNVDSAIRRGCKWALLFVDGQGVIRFSKCGLLGNRYTGRVIEDVSQYLLSMKISDDKYPGHIMRHPLA
jgi:peroxiredoxin